ncbi:uncharacterized protein VTP21DRAFT_3696 [Calcarisporiella thermophila]|uniref:uncharacterized protein n=1 Tax=Calcarisporiella thermophila TaxID=911321 RepID=UPI003743CC74
MLNLELHRQFSASCEPHHPTLARDALEDRSTNKKASNKIRCRQPGLHQAGCHRGGPPPKGPWGTQAGKWWLASLWPWKALPAPSASFLRRGQSREGSSRVQCLHCSPWSFLFEWEVVQADIIEHFGTKSPCLGMASSANAVAREASISILPGHYSTCGDNLHSSRFNVRKAAARPSLPGTCRFALSRWMESIEIREPTPPSSHGSALSSAMPRTHFPNSSVTVPSPHSATTCLGAFFLEKTSRHPQIVLLSPKRNRAIHAYLPAASFKLAASYAQFMASWPS